MADSVTPQRRQRDDGDHDSLYDSSPPSKRQRANNDEDADDAEENSGASQSPARPLLPDGYRRSPKGKGRARRPADISDRTQEHQPGSIVRVKLTNFVTYTNAEFHPGPNLNMIIGPNGTGKSTLVCAICLGLGWPPIHLGRAKDINEFVKHGTKRAAIEIELKADPQRHSHNPIITTVIPKDGGKSAESKTQFLIDGKKSTKKAVLDLARSFSIQVDNLCQFLPQDRVVEFAAMGPNQLLVETLKAAAPEQMTTWHEALKDMRKQERVKQAEQQNNMEQLKNMEDRQKSQEVDVERMRKRTDLQQRLAILQKMKPFPEFLQARRAHMEAKERRRDARKELQLLARRMEPRLQAKREKESYLKDHLEKQVDSSKKLLGRMEQQAELKVKAIEATQAKIEGCEKEIKAEKDGGTKSKADIGKYQTQIRQLKTAMENPPPEFNAAEMNTTIHGKNAHLRQLDDELGGIEEQLLSLREQHNQHSKIRDRERQAQASLQSQAGRQENKLRGVNEDTAKAWDWIQDNRASFEGEVYGPPMIECTLKDAKHADAVEAVIGAGELTAFTVTSDNDYKMLNKQLTQNLNLTSISIRAVHHPLSSFPPACSKEELNRLGFEHCVIDLIDGPEPVLAMLCDNRSINAAVYTSRDIPNSRFDALEDSNIGTAVSSRQIFQITRRREYGADGISSRANNLRPASLLTDRPVDPQAERAARERVGETELKLQQIKEEVTGLRNRSMALKKDQVQTRDEIKALQKEKSEKQTQNTQFNGLGTKLENVQRKLEEANEDNANRSVRIAAIVERQDKHGLEKGQQALDYARAVEQLRDLYVKVYETSIMAIEAKSDVEQLEAQHKDEQDILDARQREVQVLETEVAGLLERGKRLQDTCNEASARFTPEESQALEEISEWLPPQLATEIEATQAQLDALHGGNEGIIKEFESRARKIEEKRAWLQTLEASLADLTTNITEIRGQWEPRLDQLVAEISEAFAENFSQIQCAGEVGIEKPDDFEEWKIQIKVKFREGEQLSALDNHRQSGGERAVSTIFYLLSLQSLARAPFRVVDEINQGMDPRNERLVHSRMVDIACAEHTSQYFLITPKLLNNLKYHKNMKVHCIASGEYMPKDHTQLDFAKLANAALALRAAS